MILQDIDNCSVDKKYEENDFLVAFTFIKKHKENKNMYKNQMQRKSKDNELKPFSFFKEKQHT